MFRSSPHSAQMTRLEDLQRSLRELIGDAENSAKSLNDELMRRQNALENILGDLHGAEKRINASIREVQNQEEEIRKLTVAAKKTFEEINQKPQKLKEVNPLPELQRIELIDEEPPQPPDFKLMQNTTKQNNSNIDKPLRQQIVKEVNAENDPVNLQKSYIAAEKLIAAGKDLDFVANYTKLPIEELKNLSSYLTKEESSQMVNSKPEPPSLALTPKRDPRLGVLGGIKREVRIY